MHIFPKSREVGKRSWGKRNTISINTKKNIFKINQNKKIKVVYYHHKKNECGIIIKGKLLIRYSDGFGKLKTKILKKGHSFHFPPGAVHQEEALTNCEIIEAKLLILTIESELKKNMVLKSPKVLPSTTKKEIILR